MPTVTVATDAFLDLFKLEAQQRGLPELPYIVVPHPLGGIRPELVEGKARAAADDLMRALLGRSGTSGTGGTNGASS